MRAMLIAITLIACSAAAWATPVWSWEFQQDFFIVEPTETIVLQATLHNHDLSAENLTDTFFTGAHAVFNGGPSALYSDFSFSFGPQGGGDWENLFRQFDGIDLAPGESFDFVFGVLTPNSPLDIGATYWPGGLISLPPYYLDDICLDSTRFEVAPAIVPEASTLNLFGIGISMMICMRLRRNQTCTL